MNSKRVSWIHVRSLAVIVIALGLMFGPASENLHPAIAAGRLSARAASEAVPGAGRQAVPASPLFIHLVFGFDPLQALPNLPDRLSYTSEEAAIAGAYIVQFIGPVLPEWKQAVVSAGGELGDYLPDYAFLAHLDAAAVAQVQALPFVRWVGPYQPAYKVAPDADYKGARSYRITLAPWASASSTITRLAAVGVQTRSYGQGLSATLDSAQVEEVARLADVIWVEPYHLQRTYNDIAGGTIMGGTTAWSNGYTGSSVTVAIADTGLDTGQAGTLHQDFSGRVTHISSWPVVNANYGGGCETSNANANDGAADVDSGHGTHVAGSVAGNGSRSSGQIKGLGYQSTVTFQAVEQYTTWTLPNPIDCPNGYYLTGLPDDIRTLLNEAYGWGARIHNDSWGGGPGGVYDQSAAYFDDFIHQHPDMTVVVAAGNEGIDANHDGYVDEDGSISSPATAKNLISVGATDNERTTGGYNPGGPCSTWGTCWPSDYPVNPTKDDRISDSREEMAAFSSRGPMNDGRIKPDVSAPGTNILSVRSSQISGNGWGAYNQYYMYFGGTSMASPLTAGAATLVRDYYIKSEGLANPSAALIKATLINSAVDITGYGSSGQEAGKPIPNNHEGWGRVNVGAATTRGLRQFVDNTGGVTTGANQPYTYTVSTGKAFKVTLVWSDYPATPAAAKTLVNDLNLRVTAPDGSTTYWGNHFSGGWSQTGGSADTINNVENVYIQSPTAGLWKVEVIGQNVPQAPQPFALVVDGNLSPIEALSVTGIQPNHAPNNAVLTGAVISGTGFESTSAVRLTRNAEVVNGTALTVNTAADRITATLNLNGATPGVWNVQVVNSITSTATLTGAFTVIDSTLPDLKISKTGSSSSVQPGSWLTYTIAISNDGSAPATGVAFTDTLPSGELLESLSPECSGGTQILPGSFVCRTQPGSIGVGVGVTYTLVVSVPATVRGVLTNRVAVGSAEADSNPGDNTAQAVTSAGQATTYLPLVMRSSSAVSQNPIHNGDFESGRDGSWIEHSSNSYPLIMQQLAPLILPHSGSWAAWLGGVANEVSSITQQVTVPAGNSTLTFYYWGASLETTCGNDVGQVTVGSTLVDTINLCGSANTRAWVKRTVNLSAYAGQSVSLQFYAQTNGSLNSSLFIDDVAFGN